MARVVIRYSLILVLVVAASGCLEHRGDHSIVRCWADYNSLGQPALFLEKLHHQPYKAARVDHFRWMYNKPPGKSNSQLYVTAAPPIGEVWESPDASDSPGIPLVPPPEAVESPSPESEPSVGPFPPAPEPTSDPQQPSDAPAAEEPSDLELTSYLSRRLPPTGFVGCTEGSRPLFKETLQDLQTPSACSPAKAAANRLARSWGGPGE